MPTLEIWCQRSLTQPAEAHFLLEILSETISLRELIARTVREQIRGHEARAGGDFETLRRQYLMDAEVSERASQGKVSLASGKEKPLFESIDPEQEVRRALTAFEHRQFVVLVNGRQAERLDEVLVFQEQTKVTFVRLIPLAGG